MKLIPKTILKWIISLMIFMLTIYLIRVFLIDLYLVPTASMKSSILPGDYISVYKQCQEVLRNDIYVFRSPKDRNVKLVKRCIGLPGDTIEIEKNVIYINHEVISTPYDVYQVYKSWLTYADLKKAISISMNGDQILSMNDTSRYLLNNIEVKQVKHIYGDSTIELDSNYGNANYGPIIIPYKGMILENYKQKPHEHYLKEIKSTDSLYLAKEGKRKTYTFKKDFYFFLGDNRPSSEDSRVWGFVPKHSIIGRAGFIGFSKNNKGINWSRIFRPL